MKYLGSITGSPGESIPDGGIGVQALLNDSPDFVRFLFQAMLFQQFNQPAPGHYVLVGIQGFVLLGIPEVCGMVIKVNGPTLPFRDIILLVMGELWALECVLLPPLFVD